MSNVPRVQSVDGEQLYTGMKLSEMLKGTLLPNGPKPTPRPRCAPERRADARWRRWKPSWGCWTRRRAPRWADENRVAGDHRHAAGLRGVACKRAALLFALHHEPLLRAPLPPPSPLVADLADRVLPLVVPPFVAGMAQNPDALVIAALSLLESFPGESLGLPVA